MPARAAGAHPITGVVTGAVHLTHRAVGCFGARVLLRLAAAATTAGLLFALLDTGLSLLSWCFVAALVQVVVLLAVFRVALGGFRRAEHGAGRRGHRAHGGSMTARLASGLLRGAGKLAAASFRVRGPREQHCEVRRFRLADSSGRQVECVAHGTLAGVDLRGGDHVEVWGRRDRHGVLAVRRILVTVTGVGATPRPGIGFRLARAANAIAVVLMVGVGLLTAILFAGVG